MNHKLNTCVLQWSSETPLKGPSDQPHKGPAIHRLRTTGLYSSEMISLE